MGDSTDMLKHSGNETGKRKINRPLYRITAIVCAMAMLLSSCGSALASINNKLPDKVISDPLIAPIPAPSLLPSQTPDAGVEPTPAPEEGNPEGENPEEQFPADEPEYEAGSLSASGDGWIATLYYTAEARIPENAVLTLNELKGTDLYNRMKTAVMLIKNDTGSPYHRELANEGDHFYTAEITDAEGNPICPQAEVTLAYRNLDHNADCVYFSIGEESRILEADKEGTLRLKLYQGESFGYGTVQQVQVGTVQLTHSAWDYMVTASYGPEAGLPAGTELKVREIMPGTAEYARFSGMTDEALNEEWSEITLERYFDISFAKDGEKLEPKADVDVQIIFRDKIELTEEDNVQAVQIENNEANVIDAETESNKAAKHDAEAIDTVAFSADSMAVSGVVQTRKITAKVMAADGNTYEIEVTYTQEAGLPENAEVKVTEIPEGSDLWEAYRKQTAAALNADDVRLPGLYDISIIGEDGTAVEPKVPVNVSIKLANAETGNKDLHVVHFTEEMPQELVEAESKSEIQNESQIGIHSREQTEAQSAPLAEEDKIASEKITASVEGDTVTFEAQGFSIYAFAYTVDFHYEGTDYSIPGNSQILASELFRILNITYPAYTTEDGDADEGASDEGIILNVQDVADIEFSDEHLVSVEQVGGIIIYNGDEAKDVGEKDFLLSSLEPFTSNEKLTIRLTDGREIVVGVTDDNEAVWNVTVNLLDYDGSNIATSDELGVISGKTYGIVALFKDAATNNPVGYCVTGLAIDESTETCSLDFSKARAITEESWGWGTGNEESFVYDSDSHNVSFRLYEADANNTTVNNWPNVPYMDLVNKTDSMMGFEFLEEPNGNVVDTSSRTVQFNLKRAYDKQYGVRLVIPSAGLSITDNDEYYLLITSQHQTTGTTYAYAKLIVNPSETYHDVMITEWYDSNGSRLQNEKFTGNEITEVAIYTNNRKDDGTKDGFGDINSIKNSQTKVYIKDGDSINCYNVYYSDAEDERTVETDDGQHVSYLFDNVYFRTPTGSISKGDIDRLLRDATDFGYYTEAYSGHSGDIEATIGAASLSAVFEQDFGYSGANVSVNRLKVLKIYTNADGSPVSGEQVTIRLKQGETTLEESGTTGSDGTLELEFEGLSAGTYSISEVIEGQEISNNGSASVSDTTINTNFSINEAHFVNNQNMNYFGTIDYPEGSYSSDALKALDKASRVPVLILVDNQAEADKLIAAREGITKSIDIAIEVKGTKGYKSYDIISDMVRLRQLSDDLAAAHDSGSIRVINLKASEITENGLFFDDDGRYIVLNITMDNGTSFCPTVTLAGQRLLADYGGSGKQNSAKVLYNLRSTSGGLYTGDIDTTKEGAGVILAPSANAHTLGGPFGGTIISKTVHRNGNELHSNNPSQIQTLNVTIHNVIGTPTTGSLELRKEFSKTEIKDKVTYFTFEVTLNNADPSLVRNKAFPASGLKSGNTVTFDETGKARILVRARNSVTIANLPEGTTYSVREIMTPDTQYYSLDHVDGASGMITAGQTKQTIVYNTINRADLTIRKAVTGTTDTTREFEFTLTLENNTSGENETPNWEPYPDDYTISVAGGQAVMVPGGTRSYTFRMKAGESAEVNNLGEGKVIRYTVVENTELLPLGYHLKSSENTQAIGEKGEFDTALFVNEYSAVGSVTLSATKRLENSEDNTETRELTAGQFGFELKQGDTVLETAYNGVDGNIAFQTIQYTQEDMNGAVDNGDGTRTKTIVYTVHEVNGISETDNTGITYDDDKTIAVTLTDDGTGHITVSETGEALTANFINTYTNSTSAVIEGTKILTGRDMTEGEFSFTATLTKINGTDVNVSTDTSGTDRTSVTAANAAATATEVNGTLTATDNFSFEEITFTRPGTYVYTITEDVPLPAGVTMRTGSESYKATVTVTKTDDGLHAAVSYDPAEKTIINDYQTTNLVLEKRWQGGSAPADASVEFTIRRYKLADGSSTQNTPVTGALTIQKAFSGAVPPDFSASYTISGPNNYHNSIPYSNLPVTISNLITGSYTIQETNRQNAEVGGYTSAHTDSQTVNVSENSTATVTFTSSYVEEGTKVGSIQIQQYIQNLLGGDSIDVTYTISNAGYSKTVSMNGNTSLIVSDIPTDTYAISRTFTVPDHYTSTTALTETIENVVINEGNNNGTKQFTQIDLYHNGSFVLKDSYNGISDGYAASYRVTGPYGYDQTFTYSGSDITISDLPVGQYTLVKTATGEPTGYFIKDNGTDTKNETLSNNESKNVTFAQTYYGICNTITIRHTVTGTDAAHFTATYTVTKDGQPYTTASYVPSQNGATISNLKKGTYRVSLSGLPEGYTITGDTSGREIEVQLQNENENREVTFSNSIGTATQTGSIRIVQSLSGSGISTGANYFTANYVVKKNGTQVRSGSYTGTNGVTINDLEVGNDYSVEVTCSSSSADYTVGTTTTQTNSNINVTNGGTTDTNFSNTLEDDNSGENVKIIYSISGTWTDIYGNPISYPNLPANGRIIIPIKDGWSQNTGKSFTLQSPNWSDTVELDSGNGHGNYIINGDDKEGAEVYFKDVVYTITQGTSDTANSSLSYTAKSFTSPYITTMRFVGEAVAISSITYDGNDVIGFNYTNASADGTIINNIPLRFNNQAVAEYTVSFGHIGATYNYQVSANGETIKNGTITNNQSISFNAAAGPIVITFTDYSGNNTDNSGVAASSSWLDFFIPRAYADELISLSCGELPAAGEGKYWAVDSSWTLTDSTVTYGISGSNIVTLNNSTGWSKAFTVEATDENGNAYLYVLESVTETNVDTESWSASLGNCFVYGDHAANANNTLNVTNTSTSPQYGHISVTKTDVRDADTDASIETNNTYTFTIREQGSETILDTLAVQKGQTDTSVDLDLDRTYEIEELTTGRDIDGYTFSRVDMSAAAVTLTSTDTVNVIVTNYYDMDERFDTVPGSVTVNKQDDHETALPDAVFTLYAENNEGTLSDEIRTYGREGVSSFQISTNDSELGSYLPAANGDSTTLYLKETTAPTGYALSEAIHTIVISKAVSGPTYEAGSKQWVTTTTYTMMIDGEESVSVPNNPVGSISVTKNVQVNSEDSEELIGKTITIGLFSGNAEPADDATTETTAELTLTGSTTTETLFIDLEMGTYWVYELDEYGHPVKNGSSLTIEGLTYAVTETTANVTLSEAGDTGTVSITNSREYGSLKITKIVKIGTSDADTIADSRLSLADGTYTFNVYSAYTDEENNTPAVKADGTAVGDVTVTISAGVATEPAEVTDLIPGTYYVKEISGDNEAVTLDTDLHTVTVVAGETDDSVGTYATATATNTLPLGSLEVTKTIESTSDEDITATYTYPIIISVVIDETTYYIQSIDGELETAAPETALAVTNDTKLVISNLPYGTYTVEESNPGSVEITGYSYIETEGSVSSADVTVSETFGRVDLVNKYMRGASWTPDVNKLLNGEEYDGDLFEFTVTETTEDRSYTETVSTVSQGKVAFTMIQYTLADLGEATTKDFTYTITETAGTDPDVAYDNATIYVKVTVTNENNQLSATATYYSDAELASEITGSPTFSNTELGSLTVTKRVSGAFEAGETAFPFTVTIGGQYVTGDYIDGTNTYRYTGLSDDDPEYSITNNQTITFTKLPVGTYTVTEDDTNQNGYVRTTTYVIGSNDSTGENASAAVEKGTNTDVTINNHYRNAQLIIKKTISGVQDIDLDAALSGITFVVTDVTEGEEITETDPISVTISSTDLDEGTYVKILTSAENGIIPDHKYQIVETVAAPSGYVLASAAYTVEAGTADENNVTNSMSGSLTLTDADTSNGEIDFTNTYELTKLTISKAMNGGSTTQAFAFTIQVMDEQNNAYSGNAYTTDDEGGYTTIEFNADGQYTAFIAAGSSLSIYGLPVGYSYTVTEASVDGFRLVSINGEAVTEENHAATGTISSTEGTVAFINEELVDIDAMKTWYQTGDSENNINSTLSNAQVTFMLQKQVGDNEWTAIGESVAMSVADVANTDAWKVSWTDLPRYDGENLIEYRVVESDATVNGIAAVMPEHPEVVAENFTMVEGHANPTATVNIDNTLPNTSVVVNKVWNEDSETISWPEDIASVTVGLYLSVNGGEATPVTAGENSTPVTIIFGNGATVEQRTFSNLPVFDANGDQITYSIQELGITSAAVGASMTPVEDNRVTITDGDSWTVANGAVTNGEAGITNTKVKTGFGILKVNGNNESQTLTGAEFTLKKLGGENPDENGYSTVSGYDVIPVDENGHASITGLTDGKYRLYETKAPAGYTAYFGEIAFAISNGVITYTDTAYVTYVKTGDDPGTFTIRNYPGVELPATGGSGTLVYTVSGIALVLLAGALLVNRKRRKA